jgi:integrase
LVAEEDVAGVVREAKIGSPTARSRLKRGRMPHWTTLITGRAHLGYQRLGSQVGRWLLRRRVDGRYSVEEIGKADDSRPADGVSILSHEQARVKALDLSNGEAPPADRLTVSRAMADYIDALVSAGREASNAKSIAINHILPALGRAEVASLTSKQLRHWRDGLAASPPRKRPKAGREPQFEVMPTDKEGVRRRRSSANRALTVLKAALNLAYDEERVASRDAWSRRVKKFANVDAARVRYLTIDEAVRLVNACDPAFRPMLTGALLTGARYGELRRLEVGDFNPDSGTIHVRVSKANKDRHVVLTAEGAEFFRQICAGRPGSERVFTRPDGRSWQRSNQARYVAEACERARISPAVSFHILRHTWASHAVMNGVPLLVVGRNLGHRDTQMVEKHYGHLAPSYISDAIRAGAPRFGVDAQSNVKALQRLKTIKNL